jgi:hypothetical protein
MEEKKMATKEKIKKEQKRTMEEKKMVAKEKKKKRKEKRGNFFEV